MPHPSSKYAEFCREKILGTHFAVMRRSTSSKKSRIEKTKYCKAFRCLSRQEPKNGGNEAGEEK